VSISTTSLKSTLDDMPLAVIAAKASLEGNAGWREAQQALAALSSRSSLVVANTSHTVQLEEPAIVIDAVRSVLNEVRERN